MMIGLVTIPTRVFFTSLGVSRPTAAVSPDAAVPAPPFLPAVSAVAAGNRIRTVTAMILYRGTLPMIISATVSERSYILET